MFCKGKGYPSRDCLSLSREALACIRCLIEFEPVAEFIYIIKYVMEALNGLSAMYYVIVILTSLKLEWNISRFWLGFVLHSMWRWYHAAIVWT